MSRFILSAHEQGSEGWLLDRAGKATGSRAKDILATIKTGESAARRDYRLELAIERMTGTPAPQGFVSQEMMWGTEQEPFSRMAFEERTGLIVNEAGFAYLPDVMAGCSVDGFIDDGGRLGFWESKSPKSFTHIQYLKAKRLPPEHEPQILHNFYVTGAEFADFVSFDPRLIPALQMFHIRIERDDRAVKEYEEKLLAFLDEVDSEYQSLMRLAA